MAKCVCKKLESESIYSQMYQLLFVGQLWLDFTLIVNEYNIV